MTFRELYALEKFGHFFQILGDENAHAAVNVIVDEEHDMQMGQF